MMDMQVQAPVHTSPYSHYSEVLFGAALLSCAEGPCCLRAVLLQERSMLLSTAATAAATSAGRLSQACE
jgi:hypothetical protein